ncbi:MAG: CCA tRNA nucleotidyltransferase [Pirellulaceae bacterium]
MPSHDPQAAREFSIEIVQTLQQHGFQALWAGGCVRDLLLGKQPQDYDVATDARPEQIQEIFGHQRTLAIGAAFGVITVQGGKRKGQIEVATFRSDIGYSDGRRPDEVRFTDAEQDALRRDFTINGMFYEPLENRVLDYVGGMRDLSRGLIRSIGNPYYRFEEDKLRMLRGVRFASTFGFEMQLATYAAIRNFARHIHVVSAERIAIEIRKMLVHRNRVQAVIMLRDLTLLRELLPELCPVVPHVPRWNATLRALDRLKQPDLPMALAALFRFSSARSLIAENNRQPIEPLATVCARWKLPNDEAKDADWLLRKESVLRAADKTPWPVLQRLLIDPRYPRLQRLAEGVARSQTNGFRETSLRGVAAAQAKAQLPSGELNPPPLVTGSDLIAAGLRPGPEFQEILNGIRDRQLLGEIETADEAVSVARAWRTDS